MIATIVRMAMKVIEAMKAMVAMMTIISQYNAIPHSSHDCILQYSSTMRQRRENKTMRQYFTPESSTIKLYSARHNTAQ